MKHSAMEPAEAREIFVEVWGERGASQAATEIGRNNVTISRWCAGETAIGPMEAKFLRLILALHRKGRPWREWVADPAPAKRTAKDLI